LLLQVDSCCGSQDHDTAFAEYALFRDALNATGACVRACCMAWLAEPPTSLLLIITPPAISMLSVPRAIAGREVYFSLCGWESWYAPVGYSLGNQWRIAGDGSGWGPLTNCMNVISTITQYAGAYGFNDPGACCPGTLLLTVHRSPYSA